MRWCRVPLAIVFSLVLPLANTVALLGYAALGMVVITIGPDGENVVRQSVGTHALLFAIALYITACLQGAAGTALWFPVSTNLLARRFFFLVGALTAAAEAFALWFHTDLGFSLAGPFQDFNYFGILAAAALIAYVRRTTTSANASSDSIAGTQSGFLRRGAALLLDWAILEACIVPPVVLFCTFFPNDSRFHWMPGVRDPLAYVPLLVMILYGAAMESGRWQATIGKVVLDIEVQTTDGKALSFRSALIRNFVKPFSHALLLVGVLISLFTKRRQAAHDMVAASVVVRAGSRHNRANEVTESEDLQQTDPRAWSKELALAIALLTAGGVRSVGWHFTPAIDESNCVGAHSEAQRKAWDFEAQGRELADRYKAMMSQLRGRTYTLDSYDRKRLRSAKAKLDEQLTLGYQTTAKDISEAQRMCTGVPFWLRAVLPHRNHHSRDLEMLRQRVRKARDGAAWWRDQVPRV